MDWVFNRIKDRKKRLDYRRHLLLSAKFAKFVFALADIASDIYYISTVHYFNKIVFYLSIASLCALPTIIYLYFFYLYYKCYNKFEGKSKKIIFLIFWIFCGPAACICYPFIMVLENFLPEDLRDLSSFASLEYFYEALPQLCIQVLNNNISKSWKTSKLISFIFSSISLFLGFFQLAKSKFNLDYISFLEDIEQSVLENVKKKCDEHNEIHEDIKDRMKNKILNTSIFEDNLNHNQILIIREIPKEFIKLKFYELYDINRLTLNLNYMPITDTIYSDYHHNFVETSLKEEFYSNTLKIEKKELLSRCCKPKGLYILSKILLVFTILVFNIVYLIVAEFKYEYKRYLLLFFIGWYYKHSISNIQKLEKNIPIKYLAFFRVFTITDFYNLVHLLYKIEIKINNPIKTELIHFPYFWVFFICFQILNYLDIRRNVNFHITAIVFSFVYLLLPVLRIILLLLKRKKDFEYF